MFMSAINVHSDLQACFHVNEMPLTNLFTFDLDGFFLLSELSSRF